MSVLPRGAHRETSTPSPPQNDHTGGTLPKSNELTPAELLALVKESIDNMAGDVDVLLEAEPTPDMVALREDYLREMDAVIETMLAFHGKLVEYQTNKAEEESG